MTEAYQALRSVSDNHVFVVCRDGGFYDMTCATEGHGRGCSAARSLYVVTDVSSNARGLNASPERPRKR